MYLLSVDEATNSEYGFLDDILRSQTRIKTTTEYASCQGADNQYNKYGEGTHWWLRSPMENDYYPYDKTCMAKVVLPDGMIPNNDVYNSASVVDITCYGVVPVLHLDISKIN